jgi:hypothetical protein
MQRAIVLGSCLVLGCAGEPPPQPVVSDSAGIRIVESFGPTWQRSEAWSMAASPTVEIGGAETDSSYGLSRIVGSTRLGDGTIVVADGRTQQLRWFDQSGGFIRSVGGFVGLEWIGGLGSRAVMVFDFGNLRLSAYDASGERLMAGALVVTFQASPSSVKGVFSDSSVLAVRDVRSWAPAMIRTGAAPEGLIRGPAAAFRYAADGTFLNSMGTFRGAQRIFSKGLSRFVRVTAPPFGRTTVFAVSPDDHFYVGTQDKYELKVYDIAGELTAVVRLDRANTETTQADIDRYKRARLARVHELQRADREAELDSLPYPETMPAFGPIAVDAAGNLWVADPRPFADEQPIWTVFDSGHRMLGTVETPRDLTIHEIGHDYVLGAYHGSDGAERVRLYPLEKPGTR